jgi:phage-related minor tail protein
MDLEAAIDAARLEAVELIEAEVKFGRSGLGFADRAIGQVEQLQTELQEVKERLDFLHGREVEVRIKLLQLPADFTDPTEGPAGFAQELARRVPKPRPRLGTAGNPINLQNNEPAFEDGSAARRGAARTQERDEAARFIDDLRERIELVREDQQLAGLSRTKQAQLTAEFERQRIVKQFLGEIQAKGIAATPEEIAQVEALAQKYRDEAVALAVLNDVLETEAERQQEAERAAEAHRQAIERIGDAISGAIQQADSFTDALRNVAVALANILGQDLATRGKGSLLGQLFGAAASLGGSALVPGGGLPPAIVPGSPSAKGNVFERGNLVPFARGGVVSRPTVFPMARGAGLMGEAGPEAILPLSRGRDGRLGVAGGGVTVQIINNTSAQVREERARGPSGEDVRRFIVEEMQKATASGQIDRQMGSRFGLAPQRLVR